MLRINSNEKFLQDFVLITDENNELTGWVMLEDNDYLSNLSNRFLFKILGYLDEKSIRSVAMTSPALLSKVLSLPSKTTRYFAITDEMISPIKTVYDEYEDNNNIRVVDSKEVLRKRIKMPLVSRGFTQDEVLLHASFDQARSHVRESVVEYSHDLSLRKANSYTAIVCVSLNRNDLFAIKKANNPNVASLADGACQMKDTFKTKKDNIKYYYYSIFGSKIVPALRSDNDYTKLWNSTLMRQQPSGQGPQLISAVLALLKSYNSWPHHRFTRGHHDRVDGIIKRIKSDKEISIFSLHKELQDELEAGLLSDEISKNKVYIQLLKFVLYKVEEFGDLFGLKRKKCLFN